MSTAAQYKMHALVTPAGTIPALQSRDHDPGVERMMLTGDGKIFPESYFLMGLKPTTKLSTISISAALTALGSAFYPFATTTSMYWAKIISGGGYGSGSVHRKASGSKGCIVPRKISVSHNKEAKFDFDLYWLSTDGTTAAVALASAVALPSLTTNTEAYTLGKVAVNGVTLTGVTGWDYEFGYKEKVVGSDGELYPTFGCYIGVEPKLTIKTNDMMLLDQVTAVGAAQGGTPSLLYLQKLTSTGRVAAGTASHIKLTLNAGQFEMGPTKDTSDGESEFEAVAYPLFDGTNDIVASNLASAIT